MSLTSGVGCVERAQRPSRFWSLFFDSMLEATFFALGGILGGFGRPKWRSKSIFGRFFGSLFSHAISASILDRFLEAPNLKNRALASTGARFLQNRRFRKRYEKNMILVQFLEAETQKIQLKIDSKMCCFKASHFKRFFFDFASIF